MDPNDLLSFLDGPGELATPPSSSSGSGSGSDHDQSKNGSGNASQDELLSLFD